MELVREINPVWERRIYTLEKYSGICDGCGSPVEYMHPFEAIKVFETQEKAIFFPLDTFYCPSCKGTISSVRIFRTFEVSKEFESLSHA